MTGQWCVDAVLFSLPLLLVAAALGIGIAPADARAALLFDMDHSAAVYACASASVRPTTGSSWMRK